MWALAVGERRARPSAPAVASYVRHLPTAQPAALTVGQENWSEFAGHAGLTKVDMAAVRPHNVPSQGLVKFVQAIRAGAEWKSVSGTPVTVPHVRRALTGK